MKINCLSCGYKVELDDAYSDYDGMVKCWVCNAMLDVVVSDGCIKSVRLAELVGSGATPRAAAGSGRAGKRPVEGRHGQ